jgi:hypothetical protein
VRRPPCRLGHQEAAGLAFEYVQSSAKARLISCSRIIGRLQMGQTFLISGVCLSVIALNLWFYRSAS